MAYLSCFSAAGKIPSEHYHDVILFICDLADELKKFNNEISLYTTNDIALSSQSNFLLYYYMQKTHISHISRFIISIDEHTF